MAEKISMSLSGAPAKNAMAVSDELDFFIQSYPGSRDIVVVRIVYHNSADRALFIREIAGQLAERKRRFTLKVPAEGDIRLKVYFK